MTTVEFFPKAVSFLSSTDVISRFVRVCVKLQGFLLLVALAGCVIWIAGFVFGIGFALIGNWALAVILPALGYGFIACRDIVADEAFRSAVLFPFTWAAAALVGLICAVYSLFLSPLALLSLLGMLVLYSALIVGEERLNRIAAPYSPLIRRLTAALLRSKREMALIGSVGFAFVLATQTDLIVWTAFDFESMWAWEHIMRPVSSWKPSLLYLIPTLLLLAGLSALSPRHKFVEHGMKAIKTCKLTVAVLATMASFTFLAAVSVDSLHGHLVIQQTAPKIAMQHTVIDGIDLKKAAWICYRLQSATPAERSRLASELARLPKSNGEAWAQLTAENLAKQLDENVRDGGDTTARSEAATTQIDESRAEILYAEARQAVTSVLSELITASTRAAHPDADLLSSFAESLIRDVSTAMPDIAIPKDLVSFAELRSRLKPLWPRRFQLSLTNFQLDPDWEAMLNRARIGTPELGFAGVFGSGRDFSTDMFFEPEVELSAIGEKPKMRFRLRKARILEWVRTLERE